MIFFPCRSWVTFVERSERVENMRGFMLQDLFLFNCECRLQQQTQSKRLVHDDDDVYYKQQ